MTAYFIIIIQMLSLLSTPDHYYSIGFPSAAEFFDRGSRFLGFAYPIASTDEFKIILQRLKKEHPKAVHHCFAWRLGVGMDQFRANDDGEPSGTAGKPILGQIDSKGLTNVAIIVVRYFGGTLLGVPGLINAYKSAASLAIQDFTALAERPGKPHAARSLSIRFTWARFKIMAPQKTSSPG